MIQSTSNLTSYFRADAISSQPSQKTPPASAQAAGTGDQLSSASTDGLRQALAQTSEIRPEVVAKGKALAVDPNYPPRQIIESLAKLMVDSRDLSNNA
jgi:uncharacterized membrane protein